MIKTTIVMFVYLNLKDKGNTQKELNKDETQILPYFYSPEILK